MPTELIIDYKPFDKQKQFHDCDKRFRNFCGGVGSGKSTAGANEAIRALMLDRHGLGMVLAPTYPMLTQATIRSFFQYLPEQLIANYNKGDNVLKLKTGSEVLFRSYDDPERLRGPNLSWIWVDEAATGQGGLMWSIMIGRLRVGLQRAWCTSTPKGKNWLWETFEQTKNDQYATIHCTSMENTYLSEDFLRSLKDTYGEDSSFYRQEVLGEYVSFEGLVYPEFTRPTHLKEPLENTEFSYVVAGVDFGYRNPWAMLVVGQRSDGSIHAIDEVYQKEITFDQFYNLINEKCNKWKVSKVFCDPSRPEYIDLLRRRDIPAAKANNDILAGIQLMKSKFMASREGGDPMFQVSKNCMNFVDELESYAYSDKYKERLPSEVPIKQSDHLADCARYIINGLSKQSPRIRFV